MPSQYNQQSSPILVVIARMSSEHFNHPCVHGHLESSTLFSETS